MVGPVAIRRAVIGDCEGLEPLIVSFRDSLGQADPELASIASSLRRLLADPDTEFWLACEGARALGYTQLRFRFSLWSAGCEAQLDDLFVALEARGHGVGSRLLDASIERARARGARILGLNTNERNAGALRLYRRAGFRAERARWNGGLQLWLERAL